MTDLLVLNSPINRLGVFAGRWFRKRDALLEIDDSRIVDDAHPLAPGDDPRHCDSVAQKTVVLMQAPERYINHSCDPNSYMQTVNGRRLVWALRDIPAGEEVTYDYSINSDGETVWTCHCGTARCRHQIHSDYFHLPIQLQLEYLPLLDDWFRQEKAVERKQLATQSPTLTSGS